MNVVRQEGLLDEENPASVVVAQLMMGGWWRTTLDPFEIDRDAGTVPLIQAALARRGIPRGTIADARFDLPRKREEVVAPRRTGAQGKHAPRPR